MALKTFNLDEGIYRKFASFCRENGISMSKQIELFIRSQMGEPEIKPEVIMRLRKIDGEKGIPFRNINELRKIIEG